MGGVSRTVSDRVAWLQLIKFTHDSHPLIYGYSKAITALFASARKTKGNYHRDTLVFPLIFLMHHYVELVLKEILLMQAYILEDRYTYEKTHDILQLWSACKPILRAYNYAKGAISITDSMIRDFHKLDPTSEYSRYLHSNKKGVRTSHLQAFPDSISYGRLSKMYKRFKNMEGCLDAMSFHLDNRESISEYT